MERIAVGLDFQTQGTESILQANDAIKLTRTEAEKFAQLEDWSNAAKETQKLDEVTNSFSRAAQAKQQYSNIGTSVFSHENQTNSSFNTHSQAQELYDSQQKSVREQISRLGNTNSAWWRNNADQYETKQREQEISRLTDKIEKLNDELGDIQDKMDAAKEANDTRGMFQLSNARSSTEQEKTTLENKLKRLQEEEKDNMGGLSKYFGMKEFSKSIGYAVQGANIGFAYRQDIANGNYVGAGINQATSIGKAVGGAATAVGTGMMLIPGMQVPGAIVAGVGMLTSGVTEILSAGKNADKAEADAYERMIATKNAANRVFNTVGSDSKENAKQANALVGLAQQYGKDTGLTNTDMLQYSSDLARYGITNKHTAMKYTQTAGKWNQETGADINQMLALQGISSRYGLSDNDNVMSRAYGAARASGLEKGQITEYLQGLQNVIESGIQNGYTKSIEEIENDLTMFTRLSDNDPLWTGQNAVNNMQKMNSGLSSATSMSNQFQVVAESAAKKVVDTMSDADFEKMSGGHAKTGTYLDYEIAMQNPNDKVYAQVLTDIKSYFGDNIAGQKEALQSIFGISSTGTLLKLIGMTDNIGKAGYTEGDIEKSINAHKITPDARTEETEKNNIISSIEANVNTIGQSKFWAQFDELLKVNEKYGNKSTNIIQAEVIETEQKKKQNRYMTGNITDAEALDAVLAPAKETYASFSKSRGCANSPTLSNLMQPRQISGRSIIGGNDDYDTLFMTMLGKYAVRNDGKVSNDEIVLAVQASDKDKTLQAAYKKDDSAAYLSALEAMLTKLFGKITISSNQ